jgi:hypothetical protein
MIKRLFVLVIVMFCIGQAHSQTFMHGAGTGVMITTMKNADAGAFGTLMYNPRVTVMESESSSITVGIPLTLGISGSYNYSSYYGEESNLNYLINAPLIVNMNWGAGSSKDTKDRFGFFLGAGFGINNGSYKITEYVTENGYETYYETNKSITTFGPAANAGVRFAVGNGSHNIEVLLSYMKGINNEKPNTFGIQGVFNF